MDEYHRSVERDLPEGARAFVLADWHYNYNDERSPHDSWLRRIEFLRDLEGESASVQLRLLGAFHDRWVIVRYCGISAFSVSGELIFPPGHEQDWIYDEVHLSDSNRVEHVIQFEKFVIRAEAADLFVSFEPL
jgi:hypothetical protein